MATITNGKKALINSMQHMDSFIELDDNLLEELLTEEGKHKNISSAKASVISLISAMNATSAKMVVILHLPRISLAKYMIINVMYAFLLLIILLICFFERY